MRRAVIVAGWCLLALVALSGSAVAADNPGLAGFEPEESEVDPGETVEIDLTIQVISSNEDEAVESIAYTVVYDPEALSVTDVEQGSWMRSGAETNVSFETETDDEAGRLTVEQAREPPAGGVVGSGTTATITFEASPEAPPSSAVVRYETYDAQMLEYPLPFHRLTEMGTTVHIDGGGEELDPLAEDGNGDDSPGIITPDDEGSDGVDADGASDGNDDTPETAEDQPGLGVVVAALGLLIAAAFRRQTT